MGSKKKSFEEIRKARENTAVLTHKILPTFDKLYKSTEMKLDLEIM